MPETTTRQPSRNYIHFPMVMLRCLRFILHLLLGITLAVVYPWLQRRLQQKILRNWSAQLLDIFNISITLNADKTWPEHGPGLIVCNHVSWLDIFALNAIVPMRFVAKSEVRSWPIIGWLCVRTNTLFIERGKARSAARVNAEMVSLLAAGELLAIFPEGTTTDGKQLAHFHSSLLQPAVDAQVPVMPVALRYQDKLGTHSTVPAYIGDISFLSSLWSLLNTDELHVQVAIMPPISNHDLQRRELSSKAQQQVALALHALHSSPVQTVYEPLPDGICPGIQFRSLYSLLIHLPLDK